VCETSGCGGTYSDDRFAGDCDANGCDYNPYRMGNKDFYGKGLTVDTSKKFTVVSQFQQNKLTQFFVQNNKKIEIPAPKWDGIPSDSSSLTPEFCKAAPIAFGDRDRFGEIGGFDQLNAALQVPMVLVMSIWDDVSSVSRKPNAKQARISRKTDSSTR
jgi:cellulose 1,4-beta-cellobiosidase